LENKLSIEKNLSQVIRERIVAAGARYHANDNIADFLNYGELDLLVDEVAEKFQGVLSSLIIDTENDHNTQDTARRVAKMFIKETFSGRYRSVPKITAFPNMGYKSLYTTGPISVRSTCAHHFQNIVGKCWVGIVPEQEVIGLSKFNRLVHHICERPQIQEEMTTQIADALKPAVINHIYEDPEYAEYMHGAVIEGIRSVMGDMDDELLFEIGMLVFDRIELK
jgi:GTP cyclohydrolase I